MTIIFIFIIIYLLILFFKSKIHVDWKSFFKRRLPKVR